MQQKRQPGNKSITKVLRYNPSSIKLTDKSNYINEVSLRYANALILISKKSGLQQIHNDFESFIELMKTNKDLKLIINNPLINNSKKSTILEKIEAAKKAKNIADKKKK